MLCVFVNWDVKKTKHCLVARSHQHANVLTHYNVSRVFTRSGRAPMCELWLNVNHTPAKFHDCIWHTAALLLLWQKPAHRKINTCQSAKINSAVVPITAGVSWTTFSQWWYAHRLIRCKQHEPHCHSWYKKRWNEYHFNTMSFKDTAFHYISLGSVPEPCTVRAVYLFIFLKLLVVSLHEAFYFFLAQMSVVTEEIMLRFVRHLVPCYIKRSTHCYRDLKRQLH